MERANAGFLAVVALSALVGAAVAMGHGGELQAQDATETFDRIRVDVTDAAIRDGGLEVTVTAENPTVHDLTVTGTVVRVHNASATKLAFGPASVVSGGTSLPADGSLTATYRVRVGPSRLPALRAALDGDAAVTVKYSFELRGVSAAVAKTDPEPTAEGR